MSFFNALRCAARGVTARYGWDTLWHRRTLFDRGRVTERGRRAYEDMDEANPDRARLSASGSSRAGDGTRDATEPDWSGLMRAAQDGDRAAYDTLLRSLLPLLRAYVRRRVGDAAASEDLVQDVLLSIHRARHTYRPERAFAPWWRTVARNATIDYYRRRGRRVGRELSIEGIDIPDENAGPAESEELSPELGEALAALPDGQREAVELIHLRGLSVAEAAKEAGVTPGALKVRAHRGYRAMRRRLEEEGW